MKNGCIDSKNSGGQKKTIDQSDYTLLDDISRFGLLGLSTICQIQINKISTQQDCQN